MIHVITGQTATGKTKRAIELANKLNGELINADARQIYKKLDIITGKDLDLTTGQFKIWKSDVHKDIGYYEIPNSHPQTGQHAHSSIQSELNLRIWLYDIIDPSTSFSAVEYAELALQIIEDILSRGKTPIVVGGTYFYIQQLLYSTVRTHVKTDDYLRTELQSKPITELQRMLSEKNLILFRSLNNSERNNPQRLIRKIEIEMAEHVEQSEMKAFPYEFSIDGWQYESRSFLREQITKRVEERLSDGAVDEVRRLLKEGYGDMSPGLATIGYKQIMALLNNQYTQKKMKEEWIAKEMQYAKRQLTFMKRDEHIIWHLI